MKPNQNKLVLLILVEQSFEKMEKIWFHNLWSLEVTPGIILIVAEYGQAGLSTNMNKTVCILRRADTLKKGMYLTIPDLAMGK